MGKNEFHGVNLISIPVKIIRDQLLNIPITSFSKQEAIWHYNLTFSKISVSKILQKQSKRKKTNISVHYCQNLILFIVGPPPPPILMVGGGGGRTFKSAISGSHFTAFVNIFPKLRYFEGRNDIQTGYKNYSVLLFSR